MTYFQQSSGIKPSPASTLSLEEVDQFLDSMTLLTREEEQVKELKVVTRRYGTFCGPFIANMVETFEDEHLGQILLNTQTKVQTLLALLYSGTSIKGLSQ